MNSDGRETSGGLGSMRLLHQLVTLIMLIAVNISLISVTGLEQDTTPVIDVFIGDSSAVNAWYSQGTTASQRWTRLYADADRAVEINTAVPGTGFVVGGTNTFTRQLDTVRQRLDTQSISPSQVRRVFIVGVGNDMSALDDKRISQNQLTEAILALFPKAKNMFPNAQHYYIPEASPMTVTMSVAYERMQPAMSLIYMYATMNGFHDLTDWNHLVAGTGNSQDGTHLNKRGNNYMAHAVQEWTNTLPGPANTGIIPLWDSQTIITLHYDMNSMGTPIPDREANPGMIIRLPKPETDTGHAFTGWATPDGKTVAATDTWQIPDNSSSTLTFTAQWDSTLVKRVRIVTYQSNPKPGDEPQVSGSMSSQRVTAGSQWEPESNAYSYPGYRFVAWNTQPDGTGSVYQPDHSTPYVMPDQNLTLYAQWEPTANSGTLPNTGMAGPRYWLTCGLAAIICSMIILATYVKNRSRHA